MIPEITVADLLTLVGLTPIVMVVVEGVKRVAELSDATIKRIGPILGPGSGILLALAAAGWQITQLGIPVDVFQAGLTGAVAGALASGLYDVVGEGLGKIVERASGGRIT